MGSRLDMCAQPLTEVCILAGQTDSPYGQGHSRVLSPGGGCATWDLRSMCDLGIRGLYLLGHALYFWNLLQPLEPQNRGKRLGRSTLQTLLSEKVCQLVKPTTVLAEIDNLYMVLEGIHRGPYGPQILKPRIKWNHICI